MSGFFVPHDLKAPLKGAASGPLAGLSVAVKDMYAIAGERTGAGNPDWLANQQPAAAHAAAIEKLLAAGATVIGKTICDEFFYSVAGMNAHYGTPTNVRAPGRIPGGSSSGSAAAAAAGVCDFALGSDTGGSVRIPASLCGLYGIRTTHGRVDTKGAMDMSPSFDTIGWLAPTAGVFRRVGAVLLGGDADACADRQPADRRRRLRRGRRRRSRRCCATRSARWPARCPSRSTSASRRRRDRPLDRWRDAVRIIQAYEIWQVYGRFVEDKHPRFGPGVAERMQIASKITKAEADAARKVHAAARDHIRAHGHARHDRGAAERALHRAADRHAGGRSWSPIASASCG